MRYREGAMVNETEKDKKERKRAVSLEGGEGVCLHAASCKTEQYFRVF